jgi:hypothetical protein
MVGEKVGRDYSYMIYIIGDSHAEGLSAGTHTCVVGGATAYSLLREDSYTHSKRIFGNFLKEVPKESWLVLCFGEVDCRHHINRFPDKIKATKDAVKKYFEFIDTLKDFSIVIWCPVPNREGEATPKQLKKHGKYPMTGTYIERLYTTRYFNLLVKTEASKRRIPIIDIELQVVNHPELYKDMVHLNEEGYNLVKNEILKICIWD